MDQVKWKERIHSFHNNAAQKRWNLKRNQLHESEETGQHMLKEEWTKGTKFMYSVVIDIVVDIQSVTSQGCRDEVYQK